MSGFGSCRSYYLITSRRPYGPGDGIGSNHMAYPDLASLTAHCSKGAVMSGRLLWTIKKLTGNEGLALGGIEFPF